MSFSTMSLVSSNIKQSKPSVVSAPKWTWSPIASAGSQQWICVDITDDCSKIVACMFSSSQIYRSIDSGVSFSVIGASSSRQYRSVSISNDGNIIIGISYFGNSMTYSTNGGSSFSEGLSKPWHYIKKSPDGSKYIASTVNNYLYTATATTPPDPPALSSWSSLTGMGSKSWTDVAISNDGTKIVACADNEGVFYSSDGGASCSRISVNGTSFYPARLSVDGRIIFASSSSGNYVNVWRDGSFSYAWRYDVSSQLISSPQPSTRDWRSGTSSSSGNFLAVGDFLDLTNNGGIFMSYNSGVTWNKDTSSGSPSNKKIIQLICTPNGDKMIAVSWGIANSSASTSDYLYLGIYNGL